MKIALIQTEIKDYDIDLNFQCIKFLLSRVEKDVDLVVLPEMFLTGFVTETSLAKESGEKGLVLMREFANTNNIAIEGSLLIEEDGKYYNRHYFVTKQEEVFYDKIHLFSLSKEATILTKGKEKDVIINYKGFRIKLLTCYDLRFVSCSNNAYKEGSFLYDMLVYVACWPESRKEQWKTLLQARAIENQAYVIGVNRQGEDSERKLYSGDSCIVNSKGEFLTQITNWENTIIYHNIDKEELDGSRNKFPVYLDWE
ncbi:MAG: nitrilase-related carbon-nitrogen hydrolase [Bacteroidota bacterium]|nr:nitrilase-related carbon-nitrogen hydrolase [Bacteroidota bacterium]